MLHILFIAFFSVRLLQYYFVNCALCEVQMRNRFTSEALCNVRGTKYNCVLMQY